MNAKRSTQVAHWIGPEDPSASSRMAPSGAVLAPEIVFQQLAFEAEALSIVRRADDRRQRR